MASSSTRRMTWRALAPIVAIAAVGLSACSNNEEPSTTPGTTPPVWTGSPAPEGDSHGSDSHGTETTDGQATESNGSGTSGSGGSLTADLETVSGASAGTVTFTEDGDAVEVTIAVTGLDAGYAGVHVHENAACEPNSAAPTGGESGAFLSAGGHLQAGGHTGVPESGDLAVVVVGQDGAATATVTTTAFTLADLEGEDGTSVVVHKDAEGERVACGVIG